MDSFVILVTSIISGGVSGIAVNMITEGYKEKKRNQMYKEIFSEKIVKFIKLTNKFMDMKLADTPQIELDLFAGMRNLKRAYQNENTYQGVINQILEFELASYDNKQKRECAIEIQDKVLNIKLRIIQIGIEDYSRLQEDHYKICNKEIEENLSEINIQLQSL